MAGKPRAERGRCGLGRPGRREFVEEEYEGRVRTERQRVSGVPLGSCGRGL